MKPRLRYMGYVWSCCTFTTIDGLISGMKLGFGYTPRAAYDDWVKQ